MSADRGVRYQVSGIRGVQVTGSMAIQIRCQGGVTDAELDSLRAGDAVELTGHVFSFRDATALQLTRALEAGAPIPVSLDGQILYAVGPSPPKPGQIIGSAGPTTTARMARFLPTLFGAGVRAVIGKGELHGDEMTAFTTHGAVYFAAIGGLVPRTHLDPSREADCIGGRRRLRRPRPRGALRP